MLLDKAFFLAEHNGKRTGYEAEMVQAAKQAEEDLYDLLRQLREEGFVGEILLKAPNERYTTVQITKQAKGDESARQLLLDELAHLRAR